MSGRWELRVHSGLHEGASAPLEPGEHALGADAQCAFILRDRGIAPRHALLESVERGWLLHRQDAESIPVLRLEPGQLARVGPVVLSVDAPDARWPEAAQVRAVLDADASEASSVVDVTQSPDVPDNPIDLEQMAGDSDVSRAQMLTAENLAAQTYPRRSALRWAGGVMAALLVMAYAGWWQYRERDTAIGVQSAPRAQDQADAAAAQADRIQALLAPIREAMARMNLSHPPLLSVDTTGRPVVDAGLVSANDHERIALVLSRFNPRPGLKVQLEQDVMAALSQFLSARSLELGVPLKAVSLGRGAIQIEGNLSTQEERDLLLAAVRKQLPPGAQLQSALTIAPDRAQRMLAALRERVPARIDGQWDNSRLNMMVRLAGGDLNQWERALIDADKRFRVPFTARLQLESPRVSVAAVARSENLPFQIRSVVGGSSPYVVLQDGSKLLVDGRQSGWRLAAIDPGSVVFESGPNRRVVLQR